jgi:hypothetical protein
MTDTGLAYYLALGFGGAYLLSFGINLIHGVSLFLISLFSGKNIA